MKQREIALGFKWKQKGFGHPATALNFIIAPCKSRERERGGFGKKGWKNEASSIHPHYIEYIKVKVTLIYTNFFINLV